MAPIKIKAFLEVFLMCCNNIFAVKPLQENSTKMHFYIYPGFILTAISMKLEKHKDDFIVYFHVVFSKREHFLLSCTSA